MTKTVPLGQRLRYPIKIGKILKRAGEQVKQREILFEYSWEGTKESGDIIRDAQITKHTSYAEWESPVAGKLRSWRIKEGTTIIRDQPAFEIEEACSHDVQFEGLCAMCGADVTGIDFTQEAADSARATVSMIHDQNNLKVSQDMAQKVELQRQKRLLQARKLVLVVDLDQTIIHACIDPTVGEWHKDPANPNYDSLRDVGKFQLEDGPNKSLSSCWYYIKKRPGLDGFLERMSQLYEMHVFTMGTRPYAVNVAQVVDPQQKLFGNRIISRNEAGSHQKDLNRLFPSSTDMVVIIDDRSDVWPNDRENLIRVVPFDYFKGIGDINSSFLPQRTDIIPTSDNTTGTIAEASKDVKDGVTEVVEEKNAEAAQEKELKDQLEHRPLAHLQDVANETEMKDADAVPDTAVPMSSTAKYEPLERPPVKLPILRDDDHELDTIERHLTAIHEQFYKTYDQQKVHDKRPGGRNRVDLSAIPDVGEFLRNQKKQTLYGTNIVLSGLVTTNVNVYQSELGIQVQEYGAVLSSKISDKVTHLVVNPTRPRTQKLREAARISRIQIVKADWLAACFSKWEHVDESAFTIDIHPNDRVGPVAIDGDEAMVGGVPEEAESGGEDEDVDPAAQAVNMDEKLALDDLKGFQVGSVDDELAEFLADSTGDEDDDEEDEADSDEGDGEGDESFSSAKSSPLKRKADDLDEEESSSKVDGSQSNTADAQGQGVLGVNHPMFKRLRLGAPRKGSGLRNVTNLDGEGKIKGSARGTDSPAVIMQDLEHDLDAEMAATLEAEMEAAWEAELEALEEQGDEDEEEEEGKEEVISEDEG